MPRMGQRIESSLAWPGSSGNPRLTLSTPLAAIRTRVAPPYPDLCDDGILVLPLLPWSYPPPLPRLAPALRGMSLALP